MLVAVESGGAAAAEAAVFATFSLQPRGTVEARYTQAKTTSGVVRESSSGASFVLVPVSRTTGSRDMKKKEWKEENGKETLQNREVKLVPVKAV